MLITKPVKIKNLSGTIYDFENIDDELPRHTHGENDVHISIVAKGKLKVISDTWEHDAECGTVLDWEPGVYHTFVALEPGSRLINLVKT